MRLALAAVLVVLHALAACSSGDSAMLAACEEGVKLPLTKPADYRRIRAEERIDLLSADEWLRETAETSEAIRSTASTEIRAGRQTAQRVSLRLTYSATGPSGRPAEFVTTCTYVDDDSTRPTLAAALLAYDGKPFALWVNGT